MRNEREKFLARWSRLKQEEAKPEQPPALTPPAAPVADSQAPAPELPPIEELTINSDFRAFLNPKVDENLRRAALKKLFSDPHFNVMDGLDTYIDDYSKSDPLPPEMLAKLRHAQQIFAWAKETKEENAGRIAALPAPATVLPASAVPPALTGEQTPPQSVAMQPVIEPLSENQGIESPAVPNRES